jgi:hypothetical protein
VETLREIDLNGVHSNVGDVIDVFYNVFEQDYSASDESSVASETKLTRMCWRDMLAPLNEPKSS